MEHTFLMDPIRIQSSLSGWYVSTGSFCCIHIFLGFRSTTNSAIYFRSFGMESNQLLGHINISSFEVKRLFILIIFINFRQMLIVQDI